jgi:hypothetical protein
MPRVYGREQANRARVTGSRWKRTNGKEYNVMYGVLLGYWVLHDLNIKIRENANLVANN